MDAHNLESRFGHLCTADPLCLMANDPTKEMGQVGDCPLDCDNLWGAKTDTKKKRCSSRGGKRTRDDNRTTVISCYRGGRLRNRTESVASTTCHATRAHTESGTTAMTATHWDCETRRGCWMGVQGEANALSFLGARNGWGSRGGLKLSSPSSSSSS